MTNLYAPTGTTTVPTSAGDVRGIDRPGSTAFLGIPFAEAPVGELRFLPPRRHTSWDGVRSAEAYGATAQRRPFGTFTTIPEPSIPGPSILNVNVFTPAAGDRDAKLPVLVWVHGGGYFAGSPASPWYDGASFNRDGVVTVTVSYRLGFDGYGWIDGGGANRGVLDQIAALEWVQENIEAFGGDPSRVTIAGQSAGGGSVLNLLISPPARGLFSAVIAHSPAAGRFTVDDVRPAVEALAARLGVPATLDGWRSIDADTIVDTEREFNHSGPAMLDGADAPLNVAAVLTGARNGTAGSSGFAWTPIVDGETLRDGVEEEIARGVGSDIPILIGTTRNEFAFPAADDLGDIDAELRRLGVSPAARADWADEVLRVEPSNAKAQLLTSALFRTAVTRVGALRTAHGGGGATWQFDFAGRSTKDGTSAHCYELPFAWDLLDAENVADVLGSPSRDLATTMHADWVRFISDGTAAWAPASDGSAGARRYEGDGHVDDSNSYRFEAEVGRPVNP